MRGTISQTPGLGQDRTSNGRDRRPAHGSDPFAVIRSRSRTQQQRDACERLLRYLAHRQAVEGDQIDRTWAQLARGLGKDVEGLTQRQIKSRFETPIRRTIGYLISWALLDGRWALYEPNGEGRCIVVSVPAGVAQSVRAAES